MTKHQRTIDLHVNGEAHTIQVNNNWTLLKVLRDELGLTGAKCGCGKGQCGSCTVLLNGKPVLACLTLAVACHAQPITTIEGLAIGGNLHPLQEAFLEHHALQCGFCTPGMIMAAVALLDENPAPNEEEIRFALRGNLCRCGTYPKVVKAIQDVSKRLEVSK
jgi:aerobic-type carbon monoxide dehydrogenase small subunit (CoxS/CutS family)